MDGLRESPPGSAISGGCQPWNAAEQVTGARGITIAGRGAAAGCCAGPGCAACQAGGTASCIGSRSGRHPLPVTSLAGQGIPRQRREQRQPGTARHWVTFSFTLVTLSAGRTPRWREGMRRLRCRSEASGPGLVTSVSPGTEREQEEGLMMMSTEPGGFAEAAGGTLVRKPSLPSMHAGQGESWNH
jgi:hypothetical protein